MNTKKVYRLEILENGSIQLLIQTVYYKDNGVELTRENWRTVLNPGDYERVDELLDDYHANIVRAAWTDEVVAMYVNNSKKEI